MVDNGRAPSGQAFAVPVEPVSRLDPTGFDPSRMAMFLEILGAMGGEADASDCSWNWINAFCEEHEGRDPDTFNEAIDAGYVGWSHDSDSDSSTIRLTDKGRSAIATAVRMERDATQIAARPKARARAVRHRQRKV